MSRWFRHYAGMMRDEKLVRVALQSKQPVERVLWVYGAILESAAEINDDGKFNLDAAEIAYFLRADEADVRRILDCLQQLGRIHDDRVAKWGARQFKSDQSGERVRSYRERQREHNGGDTERLDTVAPARCNDDVTLQKPSGNAPETETELETDKKKEAVGPKRPYTVGFEDHFWKPYPRTPVMSKSEAWREWQKLTEPDRAAAIAAVQPFKDFLKSKPDHPAVHACRFLKQRRFDGFEAEPSNIVSLGGYYAAAESPQLEAWDEFKRATDGKTWPRDRNGGWRVPSEWPPEYTNNREAI